jgi:hypothetical protein
MKEQVYKIFNEIQTGSNTKENLDNFIKIFEKTKPQTFCETIENVFLIIIKNYEKNNVAIKNIKEFIKNFLEKTAKNTKNRDNLKKFISHFCNLFTSTVKKNKFKIICIYFLSKINKILIK